MGVNRVGPLSFRDCLHQVVDYWAAQNPDSIAITAPGRSPLTYRGLARQVEQTVAFLQTHGIGRHDRLAVVLPSGPELAVACIAVAASATCAPLDPTLRAHELNIYLSHLKPQAILTAADRGLPAVVVARSLGIPVVAMSARSTADAGSFTLSAEGPPSRRQRDVAQPDQVALMLLTSGTAARPKIVPLTHRNIAVAARGICDAVQLSATDRCLNMMPMNHIHGLSMLYASLTAGGSVLCTAGFAGGEFFEWLEEFRPTWYSAAPTIHEFVLETAVSNPEHAARHGFRFIRSASAAMPRQVMADLERVFAAPFIEAYGMTEAAPQIASNRLPPFERKPGSVGTAAGPDVAIMDTEGRLMQPGEAGEIVIRGDNVMRAYEGDPAANTSVFVRGWLRTGDRGYLDVDGYLFVTGRLKEIINRGGEKISPKEVEEVLMDHPAVARAIAFGAPHPALGENVAAAVVLESPTAEFDRGGLGVDYSEQSIRAIRDFSATRLSPFKVPQQIVIVDQFPSGPTGKVRRIDLVKQLGLASPQTMRDGANIDPAAGNNPVERRIAEVWADVLGIGLPRVHDNFLQLGGHSLAATQVAAQLRRTFQLEVPLEKLLAGTTVAELAEWIGLQMASLVVERRARFEFPSSGPATASPGGAIIPRRVESGPIPLTFAQQGLWFLDRLKAGSAYNMSVSLWLTGLLSEVALGWSLNEIVRRHEALRTTFRLSHGHPMQVIGSLKQIDLPLADLTSLPAPRRQSEALRLAAEDGERPFELAVGPLLRATLLRLSAEKHMLLLTAHHIVFDGWSSEVLYRELGLHYGSYLSGRATACAELPIQYADFSLWQREWLRGEVFEDQITYWKNQLQNMPPALRLRTDRPRPANQTYRGTKLRVTIDRSVTEALTDLSQRQGVTLFMTLLAAFKTMLHRLTGQSDCPVGVPIAYRNQAETEALIGFFANTLVMRTDLRGDPPFLELLSRVRTTALGAFAHQDLPFERLVEELHPTRDPSRTPFFQVMFAFQNLPRLEPKATMEGEVPRASEMPLQNIAGTSHPPFELAPDLNAQPIQFDSAGAKFDLTAYLWETQRGLHVTWQYNSDLFNVSTVRTIARQFQTLLESIATHPERRLSELSMVSGAEQNQVQVEWNRTDAPLLHGGCFHHLFESRVEQTPDAVAVVCGDECLTYRQLNARANQMARHLWRLGATPASLVGVCLTRSVEMVIALLGVFKSGGAYLPIDPEYPAERIAYTLRDARPAILLTEQRLLPLLRSTLGSRELEQCSYQDSVLPRPALICLETDQEVIATELTDNLRSEVNAEGLAYVLYTSGSTGRPKGVMITHANLCCYVQAMRKALGISHLDRYLHTASSAFSSSVRQCALPLFSGASVVVATSHQVRDPQSLLDFVRRHHVSIMDIVPTYWRSCVQLLHSMEPAQRSALLDNQLRLIFSASEPLPADLPREWRSSYGHGARIVNMFGQTETTGIVTVHEISAFDTDPLQFVPIGRPIANTQTYVLDAAWQLAPIGVRGELYIGGNGVGRGYLNEPELTAERFVPDPFSAVGGKRLYRTRDIVSHRPDGIIEITGRADQQIKIRGFRVEPAEIEAVLREHPAVKESVVVLRVDVPKLHSHNSADSTTRVMGGGSQRLVAFVVPSECAPSSNRSTGPTRRVTEPQEGWHKLREFLRRKLPEYMVPAAIVAVAEFPRTPSGKVDRKSLDRHFEFTAGALDPTLPRHRPGTSRAPRSSTERLLAEIWKQVLGIDRVAIDENFFDLGGDSNLSVQAIAQSNQAGLNLSLEQLFQFQTVAELARVADTGREASRESATANDSTSAFTSAKTASADDADPMIHVGAEILRVYGREALERAGLAARGAEIVTDVQLEANLRGQATHNMLSIPRYARRIASGAINRQPNIHVERETAISAQIDGDNAPGQWVAVVAMETAIRKAREAGVGIVSARRSNHFGAAGHYVWQAAREGLIGVCTTNGPLILAPTGGLTPTFGNNPLAVGIPAARHHPVLLDMAMSVAPRGRIALRVAQGEPLPPGWILDQFGRPSTDLADLAAGLGVPIGDHKGYGLALVMEALAGVLSGAGFCWDHRRERSRKHAKPPDLGHFFLVLDPNLLMPLAEFTSRVDRMIEQAKAGERRADVEEIFVPGEAELRARERNLREGVSLRVSALRELRKHAREAGLSSELEFPDISGD